MIDAVFVWELWELGYILIEMNDRQALYSENDSEPQRQPLSTGIDDHSSLLRYIQAITFLKQKLHQSLLIYNAFPLRSHIYIELAT